MRRSNAISLLGLVVLAVSASACCCIKPLGGGSGTYVDDTGLGPPATGRGVVEIMRAGGTVGYLTVDNSGRSYWLLNNGEIPPVRPSTSSPAAITYKWKNGDDIDTDNWCTSMYAGMLIHPRLFILNPTPPTDCP